DAVLERLRVARGDGLRLLPGRVQRRLRALAGARAHVRERALFKAEDLDPAEETSPRAAGVGAGHDDLLGARRREGEGDRHAVSRRRSRDAPERVAVRVETRHGHDAPALTIDTQGAGVELERSDRWIEGQGLRRLGQATGRDGEDAD